jgi:predicted RNA-binding Zn-ribbon protein involved in translation (DUF1610 family)
MVKWGGLAVSVLLAVAWVGSCWYVVGWEARGRYYIGVNCGQFVVEGSMWPLAADELTWFTDARSVPKIQWWLYWDTAVGQPFFSVPLWIPLLIVGGATATAWRADARARRLARANACPACGYDRRGLEVGRVCPECGAAGGG